MRRRTIFAENTRQEDAKKASMLKESKKPIAKVAIPSDSETCSHCGRCFKKKGMAVHKRSCNK